jgi:hypothetical protein
MDGIRLMSTTSSGSIMPLFRADQQVRASGPATEGTAFRLATFRLHLLWSWVLRISSPDGLPVLPHRSDTASGPFRNVPTGNHAYIGAATRSPFASARLRAPTDGRRRGTIAASDPSNRPTISCWQREPGTPSARPHWTGVSRNDNRTKIVSCRSFHAASKPMSSYRADDAAPVRWPAVAKSGQGGPPQGGHPESAL